MLVIGVLNTKGGVGKTTLTSCLAVEAALKARVAVCDLDPQGSFSDWYRRRGSPDNPELLHGAELASDAVESLLQTSAYDFVFVDGPPGALTVTEDAIKTADFVVIPVKASGIDLAASQDCIDLCVDSQTPFLVVINDTGQHDTKLVEQARALLKSWEVPAAKQSIKHKVAFINAMTTGKSGPEKDRGAGDEIRALWSEIVTAMRKAKKKEHA